MRHRIVTLAAPGVTATKPAQSQPRSTKKTVPFEGFEKIGRTGRLETASGARSTQKRQDRRNEQLITANQKTHEQDHQGARIEARSARRNHSSFSAPYEARAAAGRAITTNQKPLRSLPCWVRTISRSRRRTRFRTTAPPIRFEVTKPTRNNFSSSLASTPKTSVRPRCAVPSDLTRANSTVRTRRLAFGNNKSGEDGVGGMTRTPYHRRPRAGAPLASTAKVFPRRCHGKTSLKAGEAYGFGLEDVVVSVFVSDLLSTLPSAGGALVTVFVVVFSLVRSWLAGGFTMVVSVFFSAGAGATSVFCSHAPRSAALAKMQINLFIVWIGLPFLGLSFNRNTVSFRPCSR